MDEQPTNPPFYSQMTFWFAVVYTLGVALGPLGYESYVPDAETVTAAEQLRDLIAALLTNGAGLIGFVLRNRRGWGLTLGG